MPEWALEHEHGLLQETFLFFYHDCVLRAQHHCIRIPTYVKSVTFSRVLGPQAEPPALHKFI